jgi:6-phosphogluconolactonase
VAAETPNPSWVAIHTNGKYLYAANEAGKNSTISAFVVDAGSGKLTLLNQVPALGEDPCYLSFDKTGKYLFVANYTSGNVVVFPIGIDGKLGAATANVHDEGKLGPNRQRQEAPHAHWISTGWAFPERESVFVADLGLDRVLFYDLDSAMGNLILHDATISARRPFAQNSLEPKPGTGPRHVVIGKRTEFGKVIYVLGELSSTVTVFRTSKEGMFNSIQELPILPSGFSGRNDAAEIAIHPNGTFLYASNRGYDSIVVFQIDPRTGKLTAAGDFSVLGKEPRHFAIDPTGNFLLAEDQLSDKIVTFRVDQKTGALTPTGDAVDVPSPVCLVFLPVE